MTIFTTDTRYLNARQRRKLQHNTLLTFRLLTVGHAHMSSENTYVHIRIRIQMNETIRSQCCTQAFL